MSKGVSVEDDRARLASLFSGGGGAEPEATSDVGKARESGVPAKGSVLVANPQRFCSRNPFARAVKDLNRFGLQGPVQGGDLSADTKAQMLPVRLPAPRTQKSRALCLGPPTLELSEACSAVGLSRFQPVQPSPQVTGPPSGPQVLLLIEHGDKGSSGVLLERRTAVPSGLFLVTRAAERVPGGPGQLWPGQGWPGLARVDQGCSGLAWADLAWVGLAWQQSR